MHKGKVCQADENALRQVLHCPGCGLGDLPVKSHQILQFVHSLLCSFRGLALALIQMFLSCVDIAFCSLVRHLDNPAAWLHITVCSLAALSQRLKMSRLRAREGGAAGKLHLATLLNALFSFFGSGNQKHTVDLSESFLSACMSYHLDDLGGLTNWSLRSPAVSVFLCSSYFCRWGMQAVEPALG